MAEVRSVRIFVSSPGDVDQERRRVELLAQRLNGEYGAAIRIEAIRWETSYYKAHTTFQSQIPKFLTMRYCRCDILVTPRNGIAC